MQLHGLMPNVCAVEGSFCQKFNAAKVISRHDELVHYHLQADLFLAPQIHAALKWFKVDMTEFPLLLRLNDAYNELPAFQDAMKEKQPDYVPS
ncbi:unnamed protein product, partial [Vitis vinifera]|uniref:Glutathione S-transferase zeta class n=1 Tax=Vitis vinifera TaxID=29760 RepID=D7TGJ4_VITVI